MTATATAQKRILVVDDEVAICRLLKYFLEDCGYAVETLTSGEQAIARVLDQAPDLLILDLKLPDRHGYEVAQELRKHYHPWTLPILMLTAMDRPADQLRGYAFGADAYMRKPFLLEDLRKNVSMLLGQPAG